MDEKKPSLCDLLFGPKDSPLPPVILVTTSPSWEEKSESEKKTVVTQTWSAKKAVSGFEEQSWSTKEKTSYNFEEEKPPPFQYSSALYYDGPVYVPRNPNAPTLKKDVEGEYDSGSASRGGDWWRGSFYY